MKYLNESELERFTKTLKRSGHLRDILLFELMLYFGLRVSEALQIRVDDVDFVNRELVIRALKGGMKRTYSNVSEKLLKKISRYIRENDIEDQLFDLTRTGAYKLFKRYLKKAKLPSHFTQHSLRHTTVMLMIRSGSTPFEVRSWLRHKSVMSSQVYYEEIQFEQQGAQMSEIFSRIF